MGKKGNKHVIKPTVTFSDREKAQKVCDTIMKYFDEMDPEVCGPTWLNKNQLENYVVSWEEYKGYKYVCVKILRDTGKPKDKEF